MAKTDPLMPNQQDKRMTMRYSTPTGAKKASASMIIQNTFGFQSARKLAEKAAPSSAIKPPKHEREVSIIHSTPYICCIGRELRCSANDFPTGREVSIP